MADLNDEAKLAAAGQQPCMNPFPPPAPSDDRMLVLLERLEAACVLMERGVEKIAAALQGTEQR